MSMLPFKRFEKLMEEKSHPMHGQVLMRVNNLDDYTEKEAGHNEERFVTNDLEEAKVVTSIVEYQLGKGIHKPVLDIDFGAKVIPSTTPGHHHLYLDKELSWEQYTNLLDVLAEVGIIEEGYRSVSVERGHTAVRLPWVKKQKPSVDDQPW